MRRRWGGGGLRRGWIAPVVALLALAPLLAAVWLAARLPALPDVDPDSYALDPVALAELSTGKITAGVPVLCYHYFRSDLDPQYLLRVAGSLLFGLPALSDQEFWTTPQGEFEKHLRYFQDTGTRVMTLDQVQDLIDGGIPLPARAVVLTIDDGDRSVYDLAFPLLKKYGVPAHLFLPTGQVGRRWNGVRSCTWRQVAEMAASGLVIPGSHTNGLHYKVPGRGVLEPVFLDPDRVPQSIRLANRTLLAEARRQDPNRWDWGGLEAVRAGEFGPVADDLLTSRLLIRAHTGSDPRWLSWPYGFANGDLDSVARLAGFTGTVSLHPRTFDRPTGAWHVGRFTMTAKTTLERIACVFPDPAAGSGLVASRQDP